MAAMNEYWGSTERGTVDYVLFAIAFVAFLMALWGIILSSPALALAGLLLFLFALAGWRIL
jgi:hypothetical protein